MEKKPINGKIHYNCKWSDGSPPTWEPFENIAENLVEDFHIKFTQKEKKPKLQILSARLESLRYVNYAFKTGMASDTGKLDQRSHCEDMNEQQVHLIYICRRLNIWQSQNLGNF